MPGQTLYIYCTIKSFYRLWLGHARQGTFLVHEPNVLWYLGILPMEPGFLASQDRAETDRDGDSRCPTFDAGAGV